MYDHILDPRPSKALRYTAHAMLLGSVALVVYLFLA